MKLLQKVAEVTIPNRVLIAAFKKAYEKSELKDVEFIKARVSNALVSYITFKHGVNRYYTWKEHTYDWGTNKDMICTQYPTVLAYYDDPFGTTELIRIFEFSISVMSGKLFAAMITANGWNKAFIQYKVPKE